MSVIQRAELYQDGVTIFQFLGRRDGVRSFISALLRNAKTKDLTPITLAATLKAKDLIPINTAQR